MGVRAESSSSMAGSCCPELKTREQIVACDGWKQGGNQQNRELKGPTSMEQDASVGAAVGQETVGCCFKA